MQAPPRSERVYAFQTYLLSSDSTEAIDISYVKHYACSRTKKTINIAMWGVSVLSLCCEP